jgi:amino acid permease
MSSSHNNLTVESKSDKVMGSTVDSDKEAADVGYGDVEHVALGPQLKRGLNARHITIISFGYASIVPSFRTSSSSDDSGVIGTGIFLSIGRALNTAGPAILVSAFVAYCK